MYDSKGKLIYDISAERVKGFKLNINPSGQEFFQPFKLKGDTPEFLKQMFGW